MAYANVKCEECGLIMPQNEAIPVEVSDAAVVASNGLSYGLSGERLRLWQQGNRTYMRNKRVFFCPACYERRKTEFARQLAPEQASPVKGVMKMWLLNRFYKALLAGVHELIG